MHRNLIFDLSGVLFNERDGAIMEPIRKAAASEEQFKALWTNMLLGRMTTKECHELLIKQDTANAEILDGTMDYDFYSRNLPLVAPSIIGTLECLSRDYNLYMLSNSTDTMRDYAVRCLGIPGRMRGICSCDVGMMKPDMDIFKLALSHFELNPKETVYFDDRMKNIYAARMCGIYSVFIDNRQYNTNIISALNNVLNKTLS